MVTEVVSTIRSSGGDYTTLSAWESGEQRDLVTADEIAVAECYDDWPTGLNNTLTISGWTVDSTRYIKVRAAAGHRHNGTPKSGFFIQASGPDYGSLFKCDVAYTRIEWLDMHNTRTTRSHGLYVGATNCTVINTIVKNSSTTAGYWAFVALSASTLLYCCLSYDSGAGSFYIGGTGTVLANCVSGNHASIGFTTSSTAPTLYNCVSYGGSIRYQYTYNASSSNNASSHTSDDAPGASSVWNLTSSDFVDAAGGDFHLASGSALIGAGTNRYSDFTIDIDGDTWPSSGAWDIGFDYYVAASSAPSITSLSAISITATSAQPRISYS